MEHKEWRFEYRPIACGTLWAIDEDGHIIAECYDEQTALSICATHNIRGVSAMNLENPPIGLISDEPRGTSIASTPEQVDEVESDDFRLGVIQGKQEGMDFARKQMLAQVAQERDWKAERVRDARNDLRERIVIARMAGDNANSGCSIPAGDSTPERFVGYVATAIVEANLVIAALEAAKEGK